MSFNIDTAWNNVLNFIQFSNKSNSENNSVGGEVKEIHNAKLSYKLLEKNDMENVLQEWLIDEVKLIIGNRISPEFNNFFINCISDDLIIENVFEAFNYLHNEIVTFYDWFQNLNKLIDVPSFPIIDIDINHEHIRSIIANTLNGVVFYNVHYNYNKIMEIFFKEIFLIFSKFENIHSSYEEDYESLICFACKQDRVYCKCEKLSDNFFILVKQLKDLNILEKTIAVPIIQITYEKIDKYIESQCQASFDKTYINEIISWLDLNIIYNLNSMFKSVFNNIDKMTNFLNLSSSKFKIYAYEIYGRMRIKQLFNIIIEYPDSIPVLKDLIICLSLVKELRPYLVITLKEALQIRLLHPGVNTADILTAYISTMKSIRMLDETGILLEMVGDPVKKYLRQRDDTVRCIVSSLTEDNNNDLAEELTKGKLLDDSMSSEDINPSNWETWEPDPIEAEPLGQSHASRSFDIISMLVNIYGSKELFIDEYRNLLADRILTQYNYDTEREIRHIELLKLRFGEAQLHECEVMLKDIADSKRINLFISENIKSSEQCIPINAMILSAQFWPARLKDEKIQLPQDFKESIEKYIKSYEVLKGNRTLNWKPHLGLVNLDIEIKDKILNFNVSPIHATIIWHFQNQTRYTINELATLMQMPIHALQRKISFWQSQGILREESNDTYVLVDDPKCYSGQEALIIDEEEVEMCGNSNHDQKEEELKIVWSYVIGMLTNLDSLTFDRMYTMLKMFAMQGPGSKSSPADLKNILDLKVKEQKLTFENGLYRLPK